MDNFKAYNDVYGFLKGDEIIKFTADTIMTSIHSLIPNNSFIGHIGGDDFIAIVPTLNCEDVLQTFLK